MTRPDRYEVVFTAAGRRGMNRLPLPAATALYEHLTGPVARNPHRLGKQLDVPLEHLRSTRRGDYRALYVIDEDARTVTVVVVAHRRDAYRSPPPRTTADLRSGAGRGRSPHRSCPAGGDVYRGAMAPKVERVRVDGGPLDGQEHEVELGVAELVVTMADRTTHRYVRTGEGRSVAVFRWAGRR